MLCLKAEVLDDYDPDNSNASTSSSAINNGGGGLGFVLPLNLGTSIHRYLRKNNRLSTRSVSSGNGSPSSSVSDFVDAKSLNDRSGPLKGGNASLYKYQLQEDVKKLQLKLQEEIDLRLALVSAVEHSESSSNSPSQLPDKAQELLNNITVLENTVKKLEQEAISLQYQLNQERNKRNLTQYHLRHLACPVSSPAYPSRDYSTEEIRNPNSTEEVEEKVEDNLLFSDVNGDPKREYFLETLRHHPNQLSEEMVLCMRDIFIFLADSSKLTYSDNTASPSSPEGHLSYSSLASFPDSPMINSFMKRPSVDMEQALEVSEKYSNPYGVPGKIDWLEGIGAYSRVAEVSWLSVGKKELEYASGALKRFRLLVEELAKVDPSYLSCNEKLAFWINVYNALIMHAFLAYGVPRSDIKLFSLMQKAAYTIGGKSITAVEIEFVVLKMKPPAHRPQIALLLALQKYKVTDEHKFSIDQYEPLLAFALSCGMYSSPAVRVFKPENVIELLKTSLKDYVQASVGINSKGKLSVPKLLYCFGQVIVDDSQLPEWICQFLSPKQAAMVRDCSSNKWRLLGARSFSVLPFDSRFRFLFLV